MIVKCLQCQHENTAQAKFCEQCAAPLVAKCPACGTPLSATSKFCPECGLATTGGQLKQSRFASRTSYTPKHIAEKILSSRDALEGERKLVTVLFSDLKGSMELLDDRDPEEARAILDPVLQLMMDAVHYYEGTVSLAMGDGIMAIFGAPVAHEDHAVRACYSALRMQDMMKQHAATVLSKFGLPLQIRVGLNSGDVVVRSVGSDLHMDYTAVGETTHLAARMEQIAKPGSILLGPGTMHLAEGYVMMKPLGLHQVKGRAAPIDVYEALGATTIRSRLQAAAARGLSAFVGREAEWRC
jgi:class 3 adenylate cyclase